MNARVTLNIVSTMYSLALEPKLLVRLDVKDYSTNVSSSSENILKLSSTQEEKVEGENRGITRCISRLSVWFGS